MSEIAEDRPALEGLSKKRRYAVQRADERLNHVGQLRDMISYHISVLGATCAPSVGVGGGLRRVHRCA